MHDYVKYLYYCYLLQIFSLNLVGKYCYIHGIFFVVVYISECNFNTVARSNHCEVIQARVLVNNHQAVSRHGTHKTVKGPITLPNNSQTRGRSGAPVYRPDQVLALKHGGEGPSSSLLLALSPHSFQTLAFCLNTRKQKHSVFKLNKILIGSPSLFIKSLHLALH